MIIEYTVDGESPKLCTLADFVADNDGELSHDQMIALHTGSNVCIGGGAGPVVVLVPRSEMSEIRWCGICSEELGARDISGGEARDGNWICAACLDNEPCAHCNRGHRREVVCAEVESAARVDRACDAIRSPLVARLLRASEHTYALRLGAAHIITIDRIIDHACGVER